MKKVFALTSVAAMIIAGCCTEPICTEEFRMVNLQVRSSSHQPVILDSAYTIRAGNAERITYPAMGAGYYTVLDDSYQPKLKRDKDQFTFYGFLGGVKVVEEVYSISADNCHIRKEGGKDSVAIQ